MSVGANGRVSEKGDLIMGNIARALSFLGMVLTRVINWADGVWCEYEDYVLLS